MFNQCYSAITNLITYPFTLATIMFELSQICYVGRYLMAFFMQFAYEKPEVLYSLSLMINYCLGVINKPPSFVI